MEFQLVKNQRYQAKLSLGKNANAANFLVKVKLISAGFKDVDVTGSGNDRIAKGKWGGETQKAKVPEEVIEVTEI